MKITLKICPSCNGSHTYSFPENAQGNTILVHCPKTGIMLQAIVGKKEKQ
jgi:hypothetical protein